MRAACCETHRHDGFSARGSDPAAGARHQVAFTRSPGRPTSSLLGAEEAAARERAQALCLQAAGSAPITVRVTKTALRRLREAGLPDGDDLVGEAYGSADFPLGVEAFMAKTKPEWMGR